MGSFLTARGMFSNSVDENNRVESRRTRALCDSFLSHRERVACQSPADSVSATLETAARRRRSAACCRCSPGSVPTGQVVLAFAGPLPARAKSGDRPAMAPRRSRALEPGAVHCRVFWRLSWRAARRVHIAIVPRKRRISRGAGGLATISGSQDDAGFAGMHAFPACHEVP